MSQNTQIPLSELEQFADWAAGEGYVRKPTPQQAIWEALRLTHPGSDKPLIYFRRKRKNVMWGQFGTECDLAAKYLLDKLRFPEKFE